MGEILKKISSFLSTFPMMLSQNIQYGGHGEYSEYFLLNSVLSNVLISVCLRLFVLSVQFLYAVSFTLQVV